MGDTAEQDAARGRGANGEPLIAGVQFEGDLILRGFTDTRFPLGWERFTWAWRALRGKSYERPRGLTVMYCVFKGAMKVED